MPGYSVKRLDTPGRTLPRMERFLSHQEGDFKTQVQNKLSLEKLKTVELCDKIRI